jgi:hypothetical protein
MTEIRSDDIDVEERYRVGLARLWPDARANHLEALDAIEAHLRGAPVEAAEAANAAHRMAGTLGIFGLAQSGEAALALERALDGDTVVGRDEMAAMASALREQISSHELAP